MEMQWPDIDKLVEKLVEKLKKKTVQQLAKWCKILLKNEKKWECNVRMK